MYNPYQNAGYGSNYGYGYQAQQTQQQPPPNAMPNGMQQYPNAGNYYQQPTGTYSNAAYNVASVQTGYQQTGYNNYSTQQYPDYQNYNAYNQPNSAYNQPNNAYYNQNPISIDPNAYNIGYSSTPNFQTYSSANSYAPAPTAIPTPVSYNTASTATEPQQLPVTTPVIETARPESAQLPPAPVHEPIRTPSSSSLQTTENMTHQQQQQQQQQLAPVAVAPKTSPTNATKPLETTSQENAPTSTNSSSEPSKLFRPLPKAAKTKSPTKFQSLNEKLEQLQAKTKEAKEKEVTETKESANNASLPPPLPMDQLNQNKQVLNKSPSFAVAKPRTATAPARSESARLPLAGGPRATAGLPNSDRPKAPSNLEFPWAKAQGVYGSWTSSRKALVISCAYKGNRLGAELAHSLAYVTKVYNMLINVFHFDIGAITVFTDEDNTNPATIPTKNNIKQGMQWLLWQAKPGDSLFFYFFGHGGMQPLLNIDGEGILPSDYEIAGYFKGRELRQALVEPLPMGAKLSLVFDCFHCGISLPKNISGAPEEESLKSKKDKKKSEKKLKKKAPSTSELIARAAEAETGFVSLFGVTKPFGQQNLRPGYLTDAFSSSISSNKGISYVNLLTKIAEHMTVLESEVIPELSSNTEVEIHQPFSI
eukprot:TRINITY_DN1142_c0_g1_i1.p1 TRINITY_DN1142_c0_g1~~TRINITY_DN1142_c0_g1_i1.p1  ORF type:complete len:648 (+),score=150.20 TRINITY_DN1142_c0_g1_i1:326-2269(+)